MSLSIRLFTNERHRHLPYDPVCFNDVADSSPRPYQFTGMKPAKDAKCWPQWLQEWMARRGSLPTISFLHLIPMEWGPYTTKNPHTKFGIKIQIAPLVTIYGNRGTSLLLQTDAIGWVVFRQEARRRLVIPSTYEKEKGRNLNSKNCQKPILS